MREVTHLEAIPPKREQQVPLARNMQELIASVYFDDAIAGAGGSSNAALPDDILNFAISIA